MNGDDEIPSYHEAVACEDVEVTSTVSHQPETEDEAQVPADDSLVPIEVPPDDTLVPTDEYPVPKSPRDEISSIVSIPATQMAANIPLTAKETSLRHVMRDTDATKTHQHSPTKLSTKRTPPKWAPGEEDTTKETIIEESASKESCI